VQGQVSQPDKALASDRGFGMLVRISVGLMPSICEGNEMVKDCPKCRLVNPPSAQRCDCGYDFAAKKVLGTYLTEKDQAKQKEDARAKEAQWLILRIFFRWFN
jgi:hypothetical protein